RDEEDRPRGAVFAAPLGLATASGDAPIQQSSTEDDTAGSLPGYSLLLEVHCRDVEKNAQAFAHAAGLPAPWVADVQLAGYLHDLGKRDRRFQAWLQYADPLGADRGAILAKSARRLPMKARAAVGLPDRWRHEALSVRQARCGEEIRRANDPMLVLWLVGTHHG